MPYPGFEPDIFGIALPDLGNILCADPLYVEKSSWTMSENFTDQCSWREEGYSQKKGPEVTVSIQTNNVFSCGPQIFSVHRALNSSERTSVFRSKNNHE